MYTSDIKTYVQNQSLKTAFIYLAGAIFTALFGGVYEIFSHGVYSNFMIYAYAFPLVLGVVPFFLLGFSFSGGFRRKEGNRSEDAGLFLIPKPLARWIYHCGILTLTVGSLLNGVLEIYGTTNVLLAGYWIAGALLLLAGIIVYVIDLIVSGKTKPAAR